MRKSALNIFLSFALLLEIASESGLVLVKSPYIVPEATDSGRSGSFRQAKNARSLLGHGSRKKPCVCPTSCMKRVTEIEKTVRVKTHIIEYYEVRDRALAGTDSDYFNGYDEDDDSDYEDYDEEEEESESSGTRWCRCPCTSGVTTSDWFPGRNKNARRRPIRRKHFNEEKRRPLAHDGEIPEKPLNSPKDNNTSNRTSTSLSNTTEPVPPQKPARESPQITIGPLETKQPKTPKSQVRPSKQNDTDNQTPEIELKIDQPKENTIRNQKNGTVEQGSSYPNSNNQGSIAGRAAPPVHRGVEDSSSYPSFPKESVTVTVGKTPELVVPFPVRSTTPASVLTTMKSLAVGNLKKDPETANKSAKTSASLVAKATEPTPLMKFSTSTQTKGDFQEAAPRNLSISQHLSGTSSESSGPISSTSQNRTSQVNSEEEIPPTPTAENVNDGEANTPPRSNVVGEGTRSPSLSNKNSNIKKSSFKRKRKKNTLTLDAGFQIINNPLISAFSAFLEKLGGPQKNMRP